MGFAHKFMVFSGFYENFPLLLGKLMLSSKGWRKARRSFYALSSVVGESCIENSTPPAPTWLSGNIFERWKKL